MSNIGNVAGGHKLVFQTPSDMTLLINWTRANLNNPNTSEESKQHSREVLDNELDGGNVSGQQSNENKNPNNVYVHHRTSDTYSPLITIAVLAA